MIDLAALRLPHQLQVDLRWYWNAAERELGLKSNFDAVIQAALPSRNKGSKPLGRSKAVEVYDHQLDAAREVRWIEACLSAVGRTHRRTLSAVYGAGLSDEAEEAWGWLADGDLTAALLLVTAERHEISRGTLRAWRKANTNKKGRFRHRHGSMMRQLFEEAEVALVQASRAYEEAHRDQLEASPSARLLRQLFGPSVVV